VKCQPSATPVLVDDVFGGRQQRAVQAHDVTLSQQLVQSDVLHTQRLDAVAWVHVVTDDATPDTLRMRYTDRPPHTHASMHAYTYRDTNAHACMHAHIHTPPSHTHMPACTHTHTVMCHYVVSLGYEWKSANAWWLGGLAGACACRASA
jgi:hypothetical protein